MSDRTLLLPALTHEFWAKGRRFKRAAPIADLVRLEPGTKGLYAQIEQKAAVEYTIPGTTRTRVAAETIRDWIKRHRRGGFDALIPKPRADRGLSRTLPAQTVDVLLAIKEGNPALSRAAGDP